MSIVDNFISAIQGVVDTISIVIQLIIMTIKNLVYFLQVLLQAIPFAWTGFILLPAFFFPIVTVVIAIMILTRIIGRD